MNELLQVLDCAEAGDPTAAAELLPLVYGELRRLARHKLAHETPGQASQPTALVHEALERLAQVDPRKAEVVKLLVFAGLTIEEIATAFEVNEKTVRRDWTFARAWMSRDLKDPP